MKRSGSEEVYSGIYSDDDDDDNDDDDDDNNDEFYTPKETPRDTPELETEEEAAQRRNQRGQEMKILTPQQMLSRLPISLAQLKAGNSSEKLKNKKRQLLYSLYRSKKLIKTIYNNLINVI